MGYRLRRGRAIGGEMRRLYAEHLRRAIAALRAGDRDLHAVRKHVKKARAILASARVNLGGACEAADRELKTANRALGMLADAGRIIETAEMLRGLDRDRLPDEAVDRLHRTLLTRASAMDQRARADGTTARASRALVSAMSRASDWRLDRVDEAGLARAIRHAHARARRGRRDVMLRPSIESYHAWRLRVKREWYQLRLIADQTGERLQDDQHRLAALVACLGRLHDVGVLTMVVATGLGLQRRERAGALMTLRLLTRDLRRRARPLGAALDDRPRDVARRIIALWAMPPRRAAAEAA